MSDYFDDDRWEFDPEGEASLTLDATDSTPLDDGSYERVDNPLEGGRTGYPEAPDEREGENEHTCPCGTPIPDSRTKCDFCLANEISSTYVASEPDTEREITGLIHAIIDAKTEHNAIAKGKSIFTGLTGDPFTTSVTGIDECEVVACLDGELDARFARDWGQLPAAAPIDSTDGQRILDTIRQNAGHTYTTTTDDNTGDQRGDRDDSPPDLEPVLFDAEGEPITDLDEVGQLIAGDTLDRTSPSWDMDAYPPITEPTRTWIVPAIALEHVPATDRSQKCPPEGQTRRTLECRECGEETRHKFSGFAEVPHPAWEDTPVWKCNHCWMTRHGPAPGKSGSDERHHQQHNRTHDRLPW